MKRDLYYILYLAFALTLLWVVRDAVEGWRALIVVGCLLGVYTGALFEGARMQRQADKEARHGRHPRVPDLP